MMIVNILSVFGIICIAFVVGKIITKIKLPAILGWLITGIVFGPYLVGLVSAEIMNSVYYKSFINILECSAGLMIGTEIIFKKIKAYGKQIIGITVIQSLATFAFVTLCFLIIFWLTGGPLYLAFIFGGIALATAPAPAISIVNEFKTKGPLTRTLIPLAAIDDIIGIIVFFTVITIVSMNGTGGSFAFTTLLGMVFLPFIVGIGFGVPTGFILKKKYSPAITLCIVIIGILMTAGCGLLCDIFIFKAKTMSFLLLGMAFSVSFANIVGEEKTSQIMKLFKPILTFSLVVVIVNLAIPLDYRAIMGAGVFTAVYIISRAIGKIGGTYIGSVVTKAEPTVKKFLGLTLLPHSGVSLIFAGISITTLSPIDHESVIIIQGTIAAAAIINEIIAVILAKQAFKWAGELGMNKEEE